MKFLRKLAAVVAMMAVCCTLVMPAATKVEAAVVCTHEMKEFLIDKVVLCSYEHNYYYNYDVDGDGDLEIVLDECTISTVRYYFESHCICGMYYDDIVFTKEGIEHSKNCGAIG